MAVPLRALLCLAIASCALSDTDETTNRRDREFTDEELHQAHTDLDENSDQELSQKELLDFMERNHKNVTLVTTDIDEEMRRKDISGDGFVSLAEHLNDTVMGRMNEDGASDAASLTEEETDRFNVADANGDGVLDKNELPTLYDEGHEGMMKVAVKHSMKGADSNNDGKLTEEEFVDSDLAEKTYGPEDDSDELDDLKSKEKAKRLFKRLDRNGDGSLSTDELMPLESGATRREQMVDSLVQIVDKDGDKHIDSKELVQEKKVLRDFEIQDYLIAWAKHRNAMSGRSFV